MKVDSDGGSGEDQDGPGSKVPRLARRSVSDILGLLSVHGWRWVHVFTEQGQEIQDVTSLQKRVEGKWGDAE